CQSTDRFMPPGGKIRQTVLQLYRDFLRLGRQKPGVADLAKREFRRHSRIPASDVVRIEQQVRRGKHLLATLSSQHVTGIGSIGPPVQSKIDPASTASKS
ncbi:hypothetical protein BOX15_Mlig011069g1, partial [Macrostomum lignano]